MNWFEKTSGKRLETLQANYSDFNLWREMISHTQSGRTLKSVFKELFDKIIWRMPNPGPRDPRTGNLDYNPIYVRSVIINYQPDIVMCLGESAQEAFLKNAIGLNFPGAVLASTHPLEVNCLFKLVTLAEELRRELANYE